MRGVAPAAVLPIVLLAACKGSFAEASGTIGGTAFDEVGSVFHAGPHILLFKEKIDCIDADFVERAYSDGDVPTSTAFTALQFSVMEEESFTAGTFVFEPNSAVRSYGISSTGESFVADRGREGYVGITELDPDNGWIAGEFEVDFVDQSVAGEFRTEYCRNMQP